MVLMLSNHFHTEFFIALFVKSDKDMVSILAARLVRDEDGLSLVVSLARTSSNFQPNKYKCTVRREATGTEMFIFAY